VLSVTASVTPSLISYIRHRWTGTPLQTNLPAVRRSPGLCDRDLLQIARLPRLRGALCDSFNSAVRNQRIKITTIYRPERPPDTCYVCVLSGVDLDVTGALPSYFGRHIRRLGSRSAESSVSSQAQIWPQQSQITDPAITRCCKQAPPSPGRDRRRGPAFGAPMRRINATVILILFLSGTGSGPAPRSASHAWVVSRFLVPPRR